MNTSIEIYLEKVSSALSEWVLPEVKTDHARNQLQYAIELLSQLKKMADYKVDIIQENYQWSEEIYKIVESQLKNIGINVGDELKTELAAEEPTLDCSECTSRERAMIMKTASAKALDLLYKEKNKIDNFNVVEKEIYDILLPWAIRDITIRMQASK
jgi:hypothetical protein